MNKILITRQEIEVPVGALIDVANILIEREITHQISDTDPENDCLILELEYDKDQRKAIHDIEDIINDFEEMDDEQEEEDED